jgi:hypothetical protein
MMRNAANVKPIARRNGFPSVLSGAFFSALGLTGFASATTYVAKDLYAVTAPAGLTGPLIETTAVSTLGIGGRLAGGAFLGDVGHAVLWDADGTARDLHPAGFSASGAYAQAGDQQVGSANTGAPFSDRAILWTGTAASAVDLGPGLAYGTDGVHQVGWGYNGHAMLWSGSAASAVDLKPANPAYGWAYAYGVGGNQQVGQIEFVINQSGEFRYHACVWNGSAASMFDLTPDLTSGDSSAYAIGTDGVQQVGIIDNGAGTHAMLWSGSAASAVDLGPGTAYGVRDGVQVGIDVSGHAILWHGSAASAIDLQDLLPTYFTGSGAYSIDAAGNIFGIAYAADGMHAVEWVASVPEPSIALGFSVVCVGCRRRRR